MAGTDRKAKAKTINEETIRNRRLLIWDKKAREIRSKWSRNFQAMFSRVYKKILFQSFSKLLSSKNTCAGQRQALKYTVIQHN